MPAVGIGLIVRDEIDYIEENISFYARQGVSQFIVMDNASTDGTRDKLVELSRTYAIEIIDQPAIDFQKKDEWTMRIVERMRALKLDWIIANDADEFWSASGMSLREALSNSWGVVTAPRQNVLPVKSHMASSNFRFFGQTYELCGHLER